MAYFDTVSKDDRPYRLLAATNPVLNATQPPTARLWREASIQAVFRHVKNQIACEMGRGGDAADTPPEGANTFWRDLVLQAWMETQRFGFTATIQWPGGSGPNQHPTSDDTDEWTSKIDWLTNQILTSSNCELHCERNGEDCQMEIHNPDVHALPGRVTARYFSLAPVLTQARRGILHRFYLRLQLSSAYAMPKPA